MDPEGQPTIDDLQLAWTNAISAEGIGGAQSETRAKLQELRNKRTTWLGKSQYDLRLCLDSYLTGESRYYS